jgi:hypothetical protein
VLTQLPGTNSISPEETTSSAFSVMDLPSSPGLDMATNHWSVSIGSMTTPVRSPRGTCSLWGLTSPSRPSGFEVGDDGLAGVEAVEALVFGRES